MVHPLFEPKASINTPKTNLGSLDPLIYRQPQWTLIDPPLSVFTSLLVSVVGVLGWVAELGL